MTTAAYTAITPREANPSASSRLFSFTRLRSGASTRFYPGAGAKLHFANRDTDTLEIPSIPSGFLAAGDSVSVAYKGATVFTGDVSTIVEHKGAGSDATQTVTCSGPWSKMARLVYLQYWKTGPSAQSNSSRLILNQAENGSAQTLNQALTEILTWATSPCSFQLGSVSVSTQRLPFDECRDITVADAVKRELRLFPKAIARFDYSTATPTLVVSKNTNPVTAAYTSSVPKSEREFVYNAHPITGVDLEIESSGTINGDTYHQITHQTAGETLYANPDCLYATLQIKGASAQTDRQSFESITEDLPTGGLNNVQWWKARHPRLANVAVDDITITDATRTISDATCVRISANTAGEIEDAGLKCEVSQFTCKATISTDDDIEEEVYLTLNYLMTNAEGTAEDPKKYTWITGNSSESGETVPSGLAQAILDERAGSLLSEQMSVTLGDTFPTLGDAIVETDGTVFLQSFDIDCSTLVANLSFGVPDYLSPEDMASVLSNFRNKCTTRSASIRKDGKEDDNAEEVGAIPPLSSSEFAPGTKQRMTIKTKDSSLGYGSIKLDCGELESGEVVSVHTLTLSGGDDDDETEPIKILATEDVTLDGISQQLTVIRAVSYNSSTHQLLADTADLTFENGLLTNCDLSETPTVITTAVEETV